MGCENLYGNNQQGLHPPNILIPLGIMEHA
jgi:hypothetical protein